MEITVIIVTQNNEHVIKQCLKALFKQKGIGFEVFLIDNNSSDSTLSLVQEHYRDNVTVMNNSDHNTYGAAINNIAKQCNSKFLCLLNPDIVLLKDTDLQELHQYILDRPKAAIVGCHIISQDGTSEYAVKSEYLKKKFDNGYFSHLPGNIAWLLEGCVLIRHSAFVDVAGFDDAILSYGKETDLCLRLRKKGYELASTKEVIACHVENIIESDKNAYAIWLKKQGGFHYFLQKHYPQEIYQVVVNRDMKKASRRMSILNRKKTWIGLNKKDQAKYHRYQAVYDSSKELLERLQ